MDEVENQARPCRWGQQQYQAGLAAEQAKLEELRKGTRPEEIQIAQREVENAKKALPDAEKNLKEVQEKAKASLTEDYNAAITAAANAVTIATNSLFVLTDIQYAHFFGNDQDSIQVADAKARAIEALLGGENSGRWTKDFINQLEGGAKAEVEKAQASPTEEDIDGALKKVKDALEKVKTALDLVPVISDLTSAELSNLDTEKDSVNGQMSTVNSYQQTIVVQKATNEYNISVAQASENTAQNNFVLAQDKLNLKKAGSTKEQIMAQEAQVKKAQANLASQKAQVQKAQANIQDIQAQIAKTILRSPIEGIVTAQNTKVGEIIVPNQDIISLISEEKFENLEKI